LNISLLLRSLNKPSCKPLEKWPYTCLLEDIILLAMPAHGAKICHILFDKGHSKNVYVVRSMRGAETECEWGPKLGEWEDWEKWNKGMSYWWNK
jgi:hypothetical protein